MIRIFSSLEELPVRPTLSILVGATDVLALFTEGTETRVKLTFLPAVARYVLCYIIRSVALFKLVAVVIASFFGQTMAAARVLLKDFCILGVAHVVCYVPLNVGC